MIDRTRWLALAWMLALAWLGAVAQEALPTPRLRLPLLSTPPTIDGDVGDAEWAGAARMVGLCQVRSPLLHGGNVSFWVGCDGLKLYLAMVSETAPGGQLLTKANPRPADGDARTYYDDSIEIVLDPLGEAGGERRRLYHAIFNARGAIYDQAHIPGKGAEAWRGRWELGNQIVGDRWHSEMAIPLSDMQVTPEDLARPFGIRVCRNWEGSAHAKQTEWTAGGGAFLEPSTLPLVYWDDAAAQAPVVQMTSLQTSGEANIDIRLDLRNPHPQPITALVRIACERQNSAPLGVDQKVDLQPGETKTVALRSETPDELITTRIRVTGIDGKLLFYQRAFQWRPTRPEPFFTAGPEDSQRAGVAFAWYPSDDTLHVKIDATALKERERVTGVTLTVTDGEGKAELATTAMPPLANFQGEHFWRVPEINAASLAGTERFRLVVRFQGIEAEPIVREFVRHRFEWEGNQLGMSDAVVPPFMPIAWDGQSTVETVLRRHVIAENLLWLQATSIGEQLLISPMTLAWAGQGGVPMNVPAARPEVVEQSPSRLVLVTSLGINGELGSARAEYEVDGLMWWTLTLQPRETPLDSLRLVIPLRNELMPLMHTCTDGIRINTGGATPAGEGVIWDGRKAARNSLIGNYVPYIWLGAEERGLCVFGENDAGWVTAENVPCQQLVRRGDTLELVLNLIAAPTTITEPRTIRIGFMATPAKPMPKDWRTWTAWSYVGHGLKGWTNTRTFLGSTYYWGGPSACLSVYPRLHDLTLWDKFAETRRTGVVDDAFIDQWVAGYRLTGKTDEERAKQTANYRAHIRAGFHNMKSKADRILWYTNARGVRFDTPEGQTFLDEWFRDAFSTRDWPYGSGRAYDLDPVASFRDYAVWYYQKMLDSGACDEIYWDDIFLQSNFGLTGTEAYALPDGSVQPSVGLRNMRELVRRTAVMMHESGRRATNMVHMTNTHLVPICSFAAMNYDWEDHGNLQDFQDKWPRDYLRAVCLGRQSGNVPIVMELVRGDNPEQAAWASRTFVGVTLTHELRPSSHNQLYWKVMQHLLDFGYGRPEVTVHNYWQAGYPLRIAGSETSSLAVAKDGAVLLVVCDYGEGGELTLTLDREALGLAGPLTVTNLETSETVAFDDAWRLPLKKHDWAMLRIQAAAE